MSAIRSLCFMLLGTLAASGCANIEGLVSVPVPVDAGRAGDTGASRPEASSGGDATSKPDARDAASGNCLIGGHSYAAGAAEATNACQICQPSVDESGWSTAKDGTSCDTDSICHVGTCVAGCEIDGAYFPTNASNSGNACQVCTPSASTSTWSSLPDGTSGCGANEICVSGQCTTACDIGGTTYAAGVADSTNACSVCLPSTSTTEWSIAPTGKSCAPGQVCTQGTCVSDCYIAGNLYAAGAANPTSSCQSCVPTASTSEWTNGTDGRGCASGEVCSAGACIPGCFAGGSVYAPSATDPSNLCMQCTPATSTTAFTAVTDGTSCGNSQTCSSGQCGTQCVIAGTTYATGQADPLNPCETCQPGTSTSVWTPASVGSACGAGDICNASQTCVSGCFIGGAIVSPKAVDPTNGCQTCQPLASTTDWSPTNGVACGTDEVCQESTCIAGCAITSGGGVTVYAAAATDPTNSCLSCQPTTSTTAWSDVAGAACGAASVCNGGACVTGCFIGGAYYASGDPNPTNSCQTCVPMTSTTGWTNSDGTSCGTGMVCNPANAMCISGCFVGTTVYSSGTANPMNVCQSCKPSSSTTAFVNDANGTSCGANEVCVSGTCERGVSFGYTGGAQSFTVPTGITQVTVTAYGAVGGGDGGGGGSVVATLSVSSGASLALYVGGSGGLPNGGYNGGAAGSATSNLINQPVPGGGGGGATDVRVGGTSFGNRVIVAGGGGGEGGAGGSSGGAGGNTTGGTAGIGAEGSKGGGGGTPSSGGAGGVGGTRTPAGGAGSSGTSGNGGAGGLDSVDQSDGAGGGGGGGGYYGGGGGGGSGYANEGAGGGGGSSYAGTGTSNVTMQAGVNNGAGQIIITY